MKKTLIDLFEQSVRQYAANTFLLEKKESDMFLPMTYGEARGVVYNLGAGLVALGIRPREKVSILSEGRNDWILSELALLYAGAISVPLSVKLEESNDLLFRLTHAEVSAVFVSAVQLPKIRAIRSRLPLLRQVFVFDSQEGLQEGEMLLSDLTAAGKRYLEKNRESFLAIGKAIGNDDYATITYTSGTTSDPKGVVLTHRNYTANVEQALTRISIPSWFRTLIILPLDHCFAHVVGFYIMIACGASVATVQVGRTPMETLKNIPQNIREVKPHFLLSVPALARNFRKGIETSVRTKGKLTQRLFGIALRTSYLYNKDGYSRGTGAVAMLRPAVALFDRMLFRKVRGAFGGQLQFIIGGGALLDTDMQRFFYAIGIPMYQGYGLSEATPIISTNAPAKHKFGSSGTLVQPLDIRITNENGNDLPAGVRGEIVVRGENVMAGYWKNPEATAETVKDGWLYTGDMGYMSEDGFLYVLGRFKSLLIAGDGEKYSPEGMEEAMSGQSPYIEQIMLHNNQNPYTVALLVPNREALRRRIPQELPAEETARRAVEILRDELAAYKAGGIYAGQFPERWLPAAFAVLDEPFTEQNGLVNSTMKVIRGKVEKRYADRIEHLYTPEGKDAFNRRNLSVFLD